MDINDQFILYTILTTVLAAAYGIFMTVKNKRSEAEKKDAEIKKQARYNAKKNKRSQAEKKDAEMRKQARYKAKASRKNR